jgi:hypothetical protein
MAGLDRQLYLDRKLLLFACILHGATQAMHIKSVENQVELAHRYVPVLSSNKRPNSSFTTFFLLCTQMHGHEHYSYKKGNREREIYLDKTLYVLISF